MAFKLQMRNSDGVLEDVPIAATTDINGNNITETYATKEELEGVGGGGTSITIDSTPTSGSSNAVSSGGVYDALAATLAEAKAYADSVAGGGGSTTSGTKVTYMGLEDGFVWTMTIPAAVSNYTEFTEWLHNNGYSLTEAGVGYPTDSCVYFGTPYDGASVGSTGYPDEGSLGLQVYYQGDVWDIDEHTGDYMFESAGSGGDSGGGGNDFTSGVIVEVEYDYLSFVANIPDQSVESFGGLYEWLSSNGYSGDGSTKFPCASATYDGMDVSAGLWVAEGFIFMTHDYGEQPFSESEDWAFHFTVVG